MLLLLVFCYHSVYGEKNMMTMMMMINIRFAHSWRALLTDLP